MYKFSKYKQEYRANLKLAIPVMFSQLGQVFVNLADNIMVGQYGGDDPLPLAATSFGSSVFFIIQIVCMGLTFGLTPIVGELFVQGRTKEASNYLSNSLVFFPLIGLVAMGLQFALIPLMGQMGQPEEVVAMATPYFKSLIWSMIPLMIFFTFKQFLEGLGNTKNAMYIVVGCNAVNILLNYMLINGAWGAPELGALGAGVATTISRILQAVAIFVVFLSLSKFRQYINGFKLRALELRDSIKLIRLGLPISSQLFFESSAFVISSIIMGLLGTNAIGANQIGITLMNCAFMMVLSIGSSTTIRTSHCYGTRNTEQLRIATNAAYHLAFVWNAITVVLFISLQSVLPRLFTSNVEMIELASLLLIFIALFQIPDGQQCISIGVLRGMQDVKIILPISFIAYWVLNIPVGCLCAFTLGMGAKGLYIGFIVGLSTAMILLGRRVRKFQKRLTLNDF